MKIYTFILLTLLIVSCSDKSKKIGLEKSLYKIIVDYQEKYPIPRGIKEYKKDAIHIYLLDCLKENNDTLITIGRFPAGISKFDDFFGVYNNDELEPTFIFDKNNLCNKLIIKKIKNINNKNFYRDDKITYPESYPPVYKYKFKKNKLLLIKIDSIWLKWD